MTKMVKVLKLTDLNRKNGIIEFSEFVARNCIRVADKLINKEIDNDTLEYGFWLGIMTLWQYLLKENNLMDEQNEKIFKSLGF